MCKKRLLAGNAHAIEKSECHRGIGGAHREYVPDCCGDANAKAREAAKSRKRQITTSLAPSQQKKAKKEEREARIRLKDQQ